ncbi:MAG: tRNA glutamyl-Q(34) synthetase GluQRS [Kordiimonadaceae bacterium]|jgi:glutamyl-Q tRNA(Asp) synthetase|nr:tRNA glutamyl-Q(34) synthetase GluQRS [Kordiimonadaceae bacterium]MBT6033948.1 tRNA glutamyl-Q(34) synthetase GluQRS [Kordiimonadaceae bacterium]
MDQSAKVITRFAPSPSGDLHLGHAYSAKLIYDFACAHDGDFILRIEDIDHLRCKVEYEQSIFDDLSWLGLKWSTPVRRQSEHFSDYKDALDKLSDKGLLYPCFCTRKDIKNEINESTRAPHTLPKLGPEGIIYPGICRNLSDDERANKIKEGIPHALRFDMTKALRLVDGPLYWTDLKTGKQLANPKLLGDVVLARKDFPASYHLSVVIDDHIQNITHVIRGQDLYYASHFHRLLQYLLGLKKVTYDHHPLLADKEGNRLAKRDKSLTLKSLKEDGLRPENLDALINEYL